MKIAVAGGSGLIGQHLISFYLNKKESHEIILISRSLRTNHPGTATVTWDSLEQDPSVLEGCDAVLNLAGETINQRWTDAAKKRIIDSRVESCSRLAQAVNGLKHKPGVVINASGMSIYGTSETETFDEKSPHRLTDFLAHVVEIWENAAEQYEGVRVVKVRVGVVLANDGGAFPKMALPFKLGVGGRVGSGRQWLSWIHIDDMVRLLDYCIRHNSIEGPVNATAPNPVTNDAFGRALARSLHRPYLAPVPSFVMKLLFGELSVLLLEGQKVLPKALLDSGYRFRYPTIDQALAQLAKSKLETPAVFSR